VRDAEGARQRRPARSAARAGPLARSSPTRRRRGTPKPKKNPILDYFISQKLFAMPQDRLDEYVGKLLQIQRQRQEAPLSLEELKEVALSVGMTEDDWRASQEAFEDHLRKGRSHVQAQNYLDAAKELEQAAVLNPYHEEVLVLAAQSHYELFALTRQEAHAQKAEDYANRALVNKARDQDARAVKILKDLRKRSEAVQGEKKQAKRYVLIGLGLLLLGFILLFFSTRSNMSAQEQELQAQWAVLDGVYQRRLEMLPKIKAVLASTDAEASKRLAQIEALQQQLKGQSEAEYGKTQQAIQAEIAALTQSLQSKGNTDVLRDILVQIEGAENRISVERRKYNQKVQTYNQEASGFLPRLFGYREKPYFQQDAVGKDAKLN
jgi:LemA protein